MWNIKTTDTFDKWFDALGDTDRTNTLALMIVLRERGPMLPRPYVDSVKGSKHSNMKELRVQSKGNPIRVFFAFDPDQTGILLCGGNKTGNEKKFYKVMLPVADKEFTAYLQNREGKKHG